MKVVIRNVGAKLVEASQDELAWARQQLSYNRQSYNPRTRQMDSKRVSLVGPTSRVFPAGLVSSLRSAAQRIGYEFLAEDERRPPVHFDLSANVRWLLADQVEALQLCLKNERGILHLPTSYGKTELAIALALVVPCRWLFLTHRQSLLGQTVERYRRRTGERAGRVGGGTFNPDDRFTVATLQTLYRSLDGKSKPIVEDAEGIIVDECHCLAAATHLKVVMRATKAYWRYGLSATPLSRSDKKNILTVGALGPVIHHVKPSDLVEAGRVSKPIIHMIRCWQHSERKTWEGAYRECVEKSSTRNGLIVQAVGRAPKPALVFVKNIKHGRFLARQFREKGHKTKFVWGDKLGSERDSVAKDLNEGALDVAVTSVIWQEGVDIPALRTIGVATGGKSGIASLQRLGRGMRLAEGKDEFVVIDIADEGNKWTERHAHARRQAYRKTGYEVQTIRPDEIETIDALQGSRVATG